MCWCCYFNCCYAIADDIAITIATQGNVIANDIELTIFNVAVANKAKVTMLGQWYLYKQSILVFLLEKELKTLL